MTQKIKYALFLVGLFALSLSFVWPIYQDAYLFVTTIGALAAGALIGLAKRRLNQTFLTTTFVTLAAYLVLALPLTNPRAFSNTSMWLSGFLEAIVGPVEAWKQIITVDLPVGTYQALLSPVFVLYLLTGVLFGWLLVGKMSLYWLAGIPVVSIVIFAISFGLINVAGDFGILGLTLPIETPLVTGSALLVFLVAYLNWGARATRGESLLVRSEAARFTANLLGRKFRRSLTASLVIIVALSITAMSMQFVGISSNRTVLRSGVEKVREIQQQVSPLSTYRMYFTNQKLFEGEMLSYTPETAPDRIRIATMPYFNGETFTVAPIDGSTIDDNMLFSRVPSELQTSGDGISATFSLKVSNLDSIWLPTVSNAKRFTFQGTEAFTLSDSLFVNRNTGNAAVIPSEFRNFAYQIEYVAQSKPNPQDILPSSSRISDELLPESLAEWLTLQKLPSEVSGSELVKIASILRERGYLSHGLEKPLVEDALGATWLSSVEGLGFEKSTAGHSVSRVDKIFRELIDKQEQMNGRGNLVATAGDDEQFATAMALIASSYGFPSRVVVGFKTRDTAEVSGVPACREAAGTGICRGQNLSAWVEVQGGNNEWLTLDVTPQFEKPLIIDPLPQGVPQNPTEAGEDSAGVLQPGKSVPSTDSECLKDPTKCPAPPQPCTNWDFFGCYVLPIFQVAGLVTVLIGPFLAVLILKRSRSRSRRRNPSQYARVVGAWEEYQDLIVDHGSPISHFKTRLELAKESGSSEINELASLADLMAYGSDEKQSVDLTEMEAIQSAKRSWEIFEAEQLKVLAASGFVKRLRAAFSLRSFLRTFRPQVELKKVTDSFRFSWGNKVSDGPAWQAFLSFIGKELRTRLSKK